MKQVRPSRWISDVRQAVRTLRKSPGYTAAAILTLALGIGANTAIFSALEGVALKPLPYRDPDRLVLVLLYNRSLKYPTYLSYPDFLDWQRGARSFEQMAAFMPAGFDVTSPGAPEHLHGYEVSSAFFSTLGVRFATGHPFSANEDRAGGMRAAVISHRLWEQRFGKDSAIAGKSVVLNGSGYTIVGVLAPGFRFEDQAADVFIPIGRGNALFRNDRTVHDVLCIARLRRGIDLGEARAEMNVLQEHIDDLNPATEKGQGVSIFPLKDVVVGDVAGTLRLLFGAVLLVLLIACANAANLLLARSAVRTREFAVRRALGATRTQIAAQMITESVLVSLAGGTLGLAFARGGLSIALAALPGTLPRAENIGLNTAVLLFAFAISTVVGILFSLAPAMKYANDDIQKGLTGGARASWGHQRIQGILAKTQVALALVLLSGAGLLLRTVHNVSAVNPGFDASHVITFQVGLSPSVTRTGAELRAAYRDLTGRLRQVAGVESVDMTALVPLGGGANSGPFWRGPRPPASMAQIPRAVYYPIGPDYPRTMHIPLLRGRYLTEADTIHSAVAALVDTLMARVYFPEGDAVGQTITIPHWGAAGPVAAHIMGVVGHVEQNGIDSAAGQQPQIYFSLYQLPDDALPIFRDEVTFAVRTSIDAEAVMPAIKTAVHDAVADETIYNIRTMRDYVWGSMGRQRLPMVLLAVFAALAFVLAAIGIYGVISYSTAQRVREIGIRMALGAAKRDVLRMVASQGLRIVLAGVVMGGAAALVLTRMLSSFSRLLYGVGARDPITFAAASLGLVAAGLIACYLPARRAAKLDPMNALRRE